MVCECVRYERCAWVCSGAFDGRESELPPGARRGMLQSLKIKYVVKLSYMSPTGATSRQAGLAPKFDGSAEFAWLGLDRRPIMSREPIYHMPSKQANELFWWLERA
jgi:hypothetical protein